MADSGRDSPDAKEVEVSVKKELSGNWNGFLVMSTPEDFRDMLDSRRRVCQMHFCRRASWKNSQSLGPLLSSPIKEESTSKAFSTRDLQERIMFERDRINSKRDRLQQQRNESLETRG
jgi:hypothetical protein